MMAYTLADSYKLPLFEEALAMIAARYRATGMSESDWLRTRRHLVNVQPLTTVPNSDAPNRLEQAVANIKAAGMWPW
jgi:hypothetical protein